MARKGSPREEFETLVDENPWAVHDPGATDCSVLGTTKPLDKPDDPVREFDRAKYRAAVVDRLVVMERSEANVKPGEAASPLSTYDHAQGIFTITLKAMDTKWAALGGAPLITVVRELSDVEDVWVADRPGGFVITAPKMIPWFTNSSTATFPLKVGPEVAKSWTINGVAYKAVVVQRFKKLGFHKYCQRVCKRLSAESVDCPSDPDNHGFGRFFVSELVGFEIQVDGKVVAEQQPSDKVMAEFSASLAPPSQPTLPTTNPAGSAAPAAAPTQAGPTGAAVPVTDLPLETAPAAPAKTPTPARHDRAKCLQSCIAGCNDESACERSCAMQKCR